MTLQGKQNKAAADQLTTVSKARLIGPIGRLSGVAVQKIEQAVKTQLGPSNVADRP